MNKANFFNPVKRALNAMGFEVGPLRSPLSEMGEANAAKLIQVMREYGLQVTE